MPEPNQNKCNSLTHSYDLLKTSKIHESTANATNIEM